MRLRLCMATLRPLAAWLRTRRGWDAGKQGPALEVAAVVCARAGTGGDGESHARSWFQRPRTS